MFQGVTPVHALCKSGALDLLKWMIESCGAEFLGHDGAAVRATRECPMLFALLWSTASLQDWQPDCLSIACAEGHLPVVQWLVEKYGGIANIPDAEGRHPCQACTADAPAAIVVASLMIV